MFRIGQPVRGFLALAIMVVVGLAIYFVARLDIWYPGLPAGSGVAMLALPLLFVFVWLFLFMLYFANWPFQKVSQPWQGILVSLLVLVLGCITYYIFHHMLHWTAHIFTIGVLWLIWAFGLGGFAGNPIPTAYGGKQPISGIIGAITTLGLTLVTWWIIPDQFLGAFFAGASPYVAGGLTGFPFVWFLIAVMFMMVWPLWPFPAAPQGTQLWVRLGFLGFFSFVLLWILKAIGLDWFTNPMAPLFILTVLHPLLWWALLFQFWPVHGIREAPRGFIVFIVGSLAGILVFYFVMPLLAWDHFALQFCFFISLFLYFAMGQGMLMPPPAGTKMPGE